MASKKFLSVSKDEFDSALIFLEEKRDLFPSKVHSVITKVFFLYSNILETFEKSKSLLGRLREAMRIVPRTEKGLSILGKIRWGRTAK